MEVVEGELLAHLVRVSALVASQPGEFPDAREKCKSAEGGTRAIARGDQSRGGL